jgi:hypothetical protein
MASLQLHETPNLGVHETSSRPILVSRVVKDLVAGGGFSLSYKGSFELKGFSESWDLYLAST